MSGRVPHFKLIRYWSGKGQNPATWFEEKAEEESREQANPFIHLPEMCLQEMVPVQH